MRDIAYREARQRLTTLARAFDDRQLETRVPACPLWTVKDVLAHLVGGPADGVAGRPLEPWNPEWTQAHVDQRKDRSIGEILEEWEQVAPFVEAILAGENAPPAHHDILNHEADIRGALGLPRLPERYGWRVSFKDGTERLSQRIDGPGTVEFHCDGEVYRAGDGDPLTVAEVEAYELWRAFYGRRSPRQVRGWRWSGGDAQPYISTLPIFGPTEVDLTEPGPESGT